MVVLCLERAMNILPGFPWLLLNDTLGLGTVEWRELSFPHVERLLFKGGFDPCHWGAYWQWSTSGLWAATQGAEIVTVRFFLV